MEAWRPRITEEAQTWLRTPWHHNARVRGAGVDCGQLVIACYVAAGLIEDFSPGQYSPDWMLHRSEERYLGWTTKYLDEVDAAQPGDVAVWQFGRCFAHGAIVTAWPTVIHAWRAAGIVCWGDATKGGLASMRGGQRPVRFFSIAGRLQ